VKLRLFYRISISCFLFTVALMVVLNIVEAVIVAEHLANAMDRLPFILRVPFGILGAFSAVGIIFLWYGMIWDCWFTSNAKRIEDSMDTLARDHQHAWCPDLLLSDFQ